MNRRGMNHVQILVLASAGIYATFAILMGVMPGEILSATPAVAGLTPLDAPAARGRDIYVGEGCAYCHTQQVRPLEQDRVFGRPSTAGDYAYATPQLLGSERTGPDLSNVAMRQPGATWHLIHLYQPRALVGESIMPAYPWLFALTERAAPGDVTVPVPPGYAPPGKIVVATPDARALVSYLLSLKQPALPPAPAR